MHCARGQGRRPGAAQSLPKTKAKMGRGRLIFRFCLSPAKMRVAVRQEPSQRGAAAWQYQGGAYRQHAPRRGLTSRVALCTKGPAMSTMVHSHRAQCPSAMLLKRAIFFFRGYLQRCNRHPPRPTPPPAWCCCRAPPRRHPRHRPTPPLRHTPQVARPGTLPTSPRLRLPTGAQGSRAGARPRVLPRIYTRGTKARDPGPTRRRGPRARLQAGARAAPSGDHPDPAR